MYLTHTLMRASSRFALARIASCSKKAETGAPEPKTKAKDNKPVFND